MTVGIDSLYIQLDYFNELDIPLRVCVRHAVVRALQGCGYNGYGCYRPTMYRT